VLVKRLGGRGHLRGLVAPWFAVQSTCQRLQQVAGVLKVATPQQGCAFASQFVGLVRRHAVVGHDHALGRGHSGFRSPKGIVFGAVLGPVDTGCVAHVAASVAGPAYSSCGSGAGALGRGLARGCAASYTLARC